MRVFDTTSPTADGSAPTREAVAPTRAGAETRDRILRAAIELFAVQGYAGTSIRDIAEHTDLTKAALYYHFSSKERILDAVTEPLVAEVRSLLDRAGEGWAAAPSPTEMLSGLVDILSRRIALLRTVFADPSVNHKPDHKQGEQFLDAFARVIAMDASSDALLRARCALGAAQVGVFATATHDPRFAEPLDRARLRRLIDGTEHLLSEDQREQIVAAALRALG